MSDTNCINTHIREYYRRKTKQKHKLKFKLIACESIVNFIGGLILEIAYKAI